MSVTVVVDVHVRPEKADGYVDHLRNAMKETRAFAGCLDAELYRDQDVPSHLIVIERWDRKEDQAAYFAWRQENGGMPQGTYTQPLQFRFYDHV